jgi:exosortase
MNQVIQSISENKIVPYLKLGIISGFVIFLYYPELRFMIHTWLNDYHYSHGFLIPLISGYIIWRNLEALRTSPAIPDFRGFFIFLVGISLLVVGYAAFESSIRRYSLIITIMGLIYFLLGKQISKILLFPVGYLIFMIPMPYIFFKSMAVHLRFISTKVTYTFSEFLGIPIIQDSAILFLPNVTLEVADGCTGIQSIIAVMAMAVLFAYFTQRSLTSKIILVVLAIPLAVIGNMFRLVITVYLAYHYGECVVKGAVHQAQGILNYMIVGGIIKKIEIKLSTGKA